MQAVKICVIHVLRVPGNIHALVIMLEMLILKCARCAQTIEIDDEFVLADYKCVSCGESVWTFHIGNTIRYYFQSCEPRRAAIVLELLAQHFGVIGEGTSFTVADLKGLVGPEVLVTQFSPLL
jgi:hypothetical protein